MYRHQSLCRCNALGPLESLPPPSPLALHTYNSLPSLHDQSSTAAVVHEAPASPPTAAADSPAGRRPTDPRRPAAGDDVDAILVDAEEALQHRSAACSFASSTGSLCSRPPLLRANTTHLNLAPILVRSPPRRRHPRSMSVPGQEGAGGHPPPFVNLQALPESAARTISVHYYPEGGWGWCVLLCTCLVHAIVNGFQLAAGAMLSETAGRSDWATAPTQHGWLGTTSICVSMLVSPFTSVLCVRKSTRLTAVAGGLVSALGVLFTSFARQPHQMLISYGIIFGAGVSLTREAATLMLAQYFKRRRDLVETVLVSSTGVGVAAMSYLLKTVTVRVGWKLGLQALASFISITFLLGAFYRSASLYHPQRRAILHLKMSKKKVTVKTKNYRSPPWFDLSLLESRNMRIVMISAGLSSVGIHTPIVYMAEQARTDGLSDSGVQALYNYIGLGWVLGCCSFAAVVVNNSRDCRISRRYLYQSSCLLAAACLFAMPSVRERSEYNLLSWVYGVAYGCFHYTLKVWTFERARARNFSRIWGFVLAAQSLPTLLGVPSAGYVNAHLPGRCGFYVGGVSCLLGGLCVFLVDARRSQRHLPRHSRADIAAAGRDTSAACDDGDGGAGNLSQCGRPLTCISEEGGLDHEEEDCEYPVVVEDEDDELSVHEDISSCGKVENRVMLSEYENNLTAQRPAPLELHTLERPRVGHKWRIFRRSLAGHHDLKLPPQRLDVTEL